VAAGAPGAGEVLTWNGAAWAPATPSGGAQITSAAGAWTVPAGAVVGDLIYGTGVFTGALADNSSGTTVPAIGVVIAKPAATTATLAYFGEAASFAGLTPGAVYYVGLAGAVTLAPPVAAGSVVQQVGVAASATTMVFNPGPTEVVL